MLTNSGMYAKDAVQQKEQVKNKEIDQYYLELQRYCRFLAQSRWDGDDLAQEALLRAIQKYHKSELSPALLNKIAYHFWIDTLRKKKHELIGLPQDAVQVNEGSTPDELMNTVQVLIEKLTPKQAVTILLKEAFSYQLKEIAELLDTTEMAVKATLHRAKKRLKKENSLYFEDTFIEENDQQLLVELVYRSLQEEDPKVLLDRLAEIPALANIPRLRKAKYSRSPLNSYCMAA
jgi:RNA polymerase sigma factor (sigma-70 family)